MLSAWDCGPWFGCGCFALLHSTRAHTVRIVLIENFLDKWVGDVSVHITSPLWRVGMMRWDREAKHTSKLNPVFLCHCWWHCFQFYKCCAPRQRRSASTSRFGNAQTAAGGTTPSPSRRSCNFIEQPWAAAPPAWSPRSEKNTIFYFLIKLSHFYFHRLIN